MLVLPRSSVCVGAVGALRGVLFVSFGREGAAAAR